MGTMSSTASTGLVREVPKEYIYADTSKKVSSMSSAMPAEITFINRTPWTLELLWLNFDGQPVGYGCLAEGQKVTMATYYTHPWVFRTSPSAEHSFKVVCSDTLQPVRVQAIIAMRTHFNWTKGGLKQQWNLISRNTPKACLENLNTQVAFAKSKSTTVELIVAPLLPWSLKLHPSFVQAHPTFKPQVQALFKAHKVATPVVDDEPLPEAAVVPAETPAAVATAVVKSRLRSSILCSLSCLPSLGRVLLSIWRPSRRAPEIKLSVPAPSSNGSIRDTPSQLRPIATRVADQQQHIAPKPSSPTTRGHQLKSASVAAIHDTHSLLSTCSSPRPWSGLTPSLSCATVCQDHTVASPLGPSTASSCPEQQSTSSILRTCLSDLPVDLVMCIVHHMAPPLHDIRAIKSTDLVLPPPEKMEQHLAQMQSIAQQQAQAAAAAAAAAAAGLPPLPAANGAVQAVAGPLQLGAMMWNFWGGGVAAEQGAAVVPAAAPPGLGAAGGQAAAMAQGAELDDDQGLDTDDEDEEGEEQGWGNNGAPHPHAAGPVPAQGWVPGNAPEGMGWAAAAYLV